jgi:hypothetical protein
MSVSQSVNRTQSPGLSARSVSSSHANAAMRLARKAVVQTRHGPDEQRDADGGDDGCGKELAERPTAKDASHGVGVSARQPRS